MHRSGLERSGDGRQDAVAWHTLAAVEARQRLQAVGPLSAGEADRRTIVHGANALPEARSRGPWVRLTQQLKNFLIYVLASAAVTAVLALQLMFTYLPWFNHTFESVPLAPGMLGFAAIAGLLMLLVLEFETAVRRLLFRAALG